MGAFYRATVAEFLGHTPAQVIGSLSVAYQHNELRRQQIRAWEQEISILKSTCSDLITLTTGAANWSLLLEYPIPRRHKRLDAVVLAWNVILCLEFKTQDKGKKNDKPYYLAAQRQVEEYALDLRDFHEASRHRPLVPITVFPKTFDLTEPPLSQSSELVRSVRCANTNNLSKIIYFAFEADVDKEHPPIDAEAWDRSAYQPVPTIIEAAETLYAGHNVRDITHSHAGATNLTATSDYLVHLIEQAQKRREKLLAFVTGVPGAGKTLAGLNVVHNPALRRADRPAGIFLSGNGPLVKIVSAAIARDHRRRSREPGGERTVSTFIQNVHVFVREGLDKPDKPPVEHVVVFDEAQRAWDAGQNLKKNGLDASEPETMLRIMDRHQDWAVVVALVGGGQEIHNGEAGLAEWGKTLREKFPHWSVFVSPKALDRDASVAGHRLFENGDGGSLKITTEPSLHLEVSQRSFRARKLTEWVDAALGNEPVKAMALTTSLRDFPIVYTRSLSVAREWLRQHTRGRRRCGLVASSGALRLRADGLELSSGFRQGNRDIFVHWFLAEFPDVRSSNQLEVAASEFECQGLELDWVGVCWGGDFTFDAAKKSWAFRNFSGTRWGNVKAEIDKKYLLNTYRVLLTRARRGLVIWIPSGDPTDETRSPDYFNSTADYIQQCGLTLI
jgi:hypothetical protein